MILGASFDTSEENLAFVEAQGFPYRLLSDVDQVAGEAYQVQRAPDHPYGKLPERFTYLIDPKGTIRKAYNVTDVNAHPQEVLEDIRALSA